MRERERELACSRGSRVWEQSHGNQQSLRRLLLEAVDASPWNCDARHRRQQPHRTLLELSHLETEWIKLHTRTNFYFSLEPSGGDENIIECRLRKKRPPALLLKASTTAFDGLEAGSWILDKDFE